MVYQSKIKLDEISEVCERFYQRDGFVKWSDVASVFGISRQAVQNRLRTAVEKGDLPADTVARWQSASSRIASSRERREQAREDAKLTIQVTLTPENLRWLRTECGVRGLRSSDVVNGLINKQRQS
jgi:hypothetical protein